MNALNVVADELVQALERVSDMRGLRSGLAGSVAFWSGFADENRADHRDALELIDVWQSIDALAAAVQERKG